MSDVASIVTRSDALAADYTEKLDQMVNGMVPTTLSNAEYASRCGALMIALSRELARCASTFGETHEIEPEEMVLTVGKMFGTHYAHCLDTIRGAGQTVN